MSQEIVVSPTQMDLGKIDSDKPRSFWFSVTNTSNKEIKCTPWASCGCTTPNLLPSIIPPKGHSRLEIAFDPLGKSGLQEKNVGVNYEIDGKARVISVTFTAEI